MLAMSRLSVMAMTLLAVILVTACSQDEVVAEKDPIVFSDLNWDQCAVPESRRPIHR